MKLLFAGALYAVMVFLASCANSDIDPSISSSSISGLKLTSDIINSKQADDLDPQPNPQGVEPSYRRYAVRGSPIEGSIEDFRLTLKKFLSSPFIYLYKIRRPESIQIIADIDSAADSLNRLKEGGGLSPEKSGLQIFPIMLEIDSNLEQLQLIEKSLSEASQLQYFQLFFFLCVLIISIVLALWALYGSLEKAEKREKQSLAFSRETILAQERERLRIARELHDTVAQDILQLSLRTETMNKEADASKRSLLCGEIVSGQREIMKRIRNICENLIPPDFQRRRLGDALQALCYNFQQRTNIECRIKIQKDLPLVSQPSPQGVEPELRGSPLATLDSDVQLQCFRIVQECLTNIEKHSKAAECSVLVYREAAGEIIISVSDDGKGTSPPNDDSFNNLKEQGCFGLWGMYERAAAMNGILTLKSEPGEGTTVTLRIPAEKAPR
jgi:signal transduction histidine kinase